MAARRTASKDAPPPPPARSRTTRTAKKAAPPAPVEDEPVADDADGDEDPAADTAEAVIEPDLDAAVVDEDLEEDEEEEEAEDEAEPVIAADVDLTDDEEDDEVVLVEKPAAPVRPTRPTPGRPPSAKEEPDPPFYVGERVRLVDNRRPRTGVPIGEHPVGALATVETVLSLTVILRFDLAKDVKEVVAFTNIESIDDDAKARRAERDRLKAAAAE